MGIESEEAREIATFSEDSNVTELGRPAIICKTNEFPEPENVTASGVNPARSTINFIRVLFGAHVRSLGKTRY
jgi:hypothetical protein